MNIVRQNFHNECETALNNQINMELHASYVYLSMAFYFDKSDVALPGLHKYFKKLSDDEREHALKLMAYQNKRGGALILTDIKSPQHNEWGSAQEAMTAALELEKEVNESLLQLHGFSSTHNDPNFSDFLENEFLQEQVDSIKEIANHVTNLKKVGDDLGVYMFDSKLSE